MPDLIERILRELDTEIVRLESELSRMRIIRDRMVEPIIPGEQILRRPDGHGYARVVKEPPSDRQTLGELVEVMSGDIPVEAPGEPQEATSAPAQVETPSGPQEAQKPASVLPVLPGISPELTERLAQDGIKLRPLSVTHIPTVEPPKRLKRKTNRRVVNRPTQMRGPEEMETAIRDWVRAQGERHFTAQELAEGLGINTPSYAIDKSRALIERGVIVEVGRKPGRGGSILYRYGGKPAPEPEPTKGNTDEERTPAWRTEGGVAGTGRPTPTTSDKDIDKLLRSVAGQIYTRPGGSGHLIVTCRRTGQATSVSSTPSAANTIHHVRTDLRRIGVRL